MKSRLFRYLAIFFFLAATTSAFTQILDPVSWSFSKEKTGENEYDLIFTAGIENKWHLYSQKLPEGGPIPTSFQFGESEHYERIGEVEEITEPEVKYDPSFNMDLTMFSHEASFQAEDQSHSLRRDLPSRVALNTCVVMMNAACRQPRKNFSSQSQPPKLEWQR